MPLPPLLPRRRRRLIDAAVAAVIAALVAAAVLVGYLNSDARAAMLITGSSPAEPAAPGVPAALTVRWTAPTDAVLGSVVSTSGVVVVTDPHGITALDAATGKAVWSYHRSNLLLCAAGSGDLPVPGFGLGSAVPGIVTVFAKNGYCSQVQSFDADTGDRGVDRTSPNQVSGQLTFGGPYAGWMGRTLLEVWQSALLRTIQYGDQPDPTNPGTQLLGCTFTDLAMGTLQFGIVQHCAADGSNARVVLNFDDPNAVNKKEWSSFKFTPRTSIDTGSASARIVGITADRVAVLVAEPEPAVVVYDAAGTEVSRTPVPISAAEITAADGAGITAAVRTGQKWYCLIGSHLLAVSSQQVEAPAPATSIAGLAPSTTTAGTSTSGAAPLVSLQSLVVAWTAAGARGLPAVVGGSVLMPTDDGLEVLDNHGQTERTIAVDRSGYTGRVDAASVGDLFVETRGPQVVALS